MNNTKKILVLALFNTGDVVLCTSAIALLKMAYPDAKITVIVKSVSGDVVRNNPVIDEVITIDYRSKHLSLGNMSALIQEIRARGFDLCLAFDGKLRSALIGFLAGIPERITADKIFGSMPDWRKLLFTRVITPDCDDAVTHQSDLFQSIVRSLTGQQQQARPVMGRIEAKNDENARRLITSLPVHEYKIALCVKGTFPLKDWPSDRFALLVDRLHERYDAAFYIVGAPSDRDYADSIIAKTAVSVTNFCGRTSLVDLAALLTLSDLFVTVDTGAVHIASTTTVPIVALYGCTSPVRWHPLNERYMVVYTHESCSPCAIRADACPEHLCMNKIQVDTVMQAIESLGIIKQH